LKDKLLKSLNQNFNNTPEPSLKLQTVSTMFSLFPLGTPKLHVYFYRGIKVHIPCILSGLNMASMENIQYDH
jgi:hypothetical protein